MTTAPDLPDLPNEDEIEEPTEYAPEPPDTGSQDSGLNVEPWGDEDD